MPGILQRRRRRRLVSNANLGHTILYITATDVLLFSVQQWAAGSIQQRLCRDLLCVADENPSRLTQQLLNGNKFVLQMSYITRTSVQSIPRSL